VEEQPKNACLSPRSMPSISEELLAAKKEKKEKKKGR
jgi:hypothetical protein